METPNRLRRQEHYTSAGLPRPAVILPAGANLTSNTAVQKALIDALLDPRNATDWPNFKFMLPNLASDSLNLAWASGITAADPMFVFDRLAALTKVANPALATAAAKKLYCEPVFAWMQTRR